MIGFGLAGIADDEVRSERGARFAAADVGHARREALAIAPSTHAAQQRRRHVLQRQIEVGHARRTDGIDERVGEIGGIEVEEPDPIDARRHLLDERDDGSLPHAPIATERGEVLRDQHDLAGLELLDLGEDVGDGA